MEINIRVKNERNQREYEQKVGRRSLGAAERMRLVGWRIETFQSRCGKVMLFRFIKEQAAVFALYFSFFLLHSLGPVLCRKRINIGNRNAGSRNTRKRED